METLQKHMSDSISRDLTAKDLNILAAIAEDHAVTHAKAFAEWALKTDAFEEFPVAQAHYEYMKTLKSHE